MHGITDALYLYTFLKEKYDHVIINHTAGEFKNEQGYHTNQIENFWSHLSRSIIGIHHWVSGKHLQRYADNTAFKYNTRHMKDVNRFVMALQGAEKRLDYKTLTGKNLPLEDGKETNEAGQETKTPR